MWHALRGRRAPFAGKVCRKSCSAEAGDGRRRRSRRRRTPMSAKRDRTPGGCARPIHATHAPQHALPAYVVRTRQNSNSPELELTRTQKSRTTPAFWLRSGPLRSAAFCVQLRSARTTPAFWLRSGLLRSAAFCVLLRSDQNSKFCVLSELACVLLRSGILRSAAFCVLPRSAACCVLGSAQLWPSPG